jgi:glutaredoxin
MKTGHSFLFIALFAASAATYAQLYKWVGPDGKVTYSDAPPPASAKTVETKPVNGAGSGNASFPFELAEAVKNHPVTLYTGEKCAPCDEGRALLNARGIPFSEKTVSTNADLDRLRQAGGDALPLLIIGRTRQKGFEQGAWNSALTAAGYPDSNKLPKSYRYPQAEAAAPAAKSAQAKHSGKEAPVEDSRAEDLPPAAGNAPPGFRF